MALKIIQPSSQFTYNLKKIGNSNHIIAWKSKGLSDESIKLPATSDNSFASSLDYISIKTRVKFIAQCLKQDRVTFTHKKIVNIFRQEDDFTLSNAFFGAVKLTTNADKDK